MKIFFSLFFLLAIVLAIYPFLDSTKKDGAVTGLPWQIDVLPDGTTQVFGLKVGGSRLSEAIDTLGGDMELAIIAATDEVGSLEMYYGYYRAGLLSGKLVLLTSIAEERIRSLRDNAVKSEYMASGLAKKYFLAPEDLSQILDEIIVGITFIPAVNLDEEVILARFGKPAKKVDLEGVMHYLYPDMGLDIALHADSKEVLQYVPPSDFQQLAQPLY